MGASASMFWRTNVISNILSWRPNNGHILGKELGDSKTNADMILYLVEKILGNDADQIKKIVTDLTRSSPTKYGIYHSQNHLYKVTICFIALKNYLREEILEEEIIAALLHDYQYKNAMAKACRFKITVEEASMNLAFENGLFSNYSQFSIVRDLVMETVPHKGFKIVKHPLQVADLMPSYGLCVESAILETEKIVEEITEGGKTTLSLKDCFDAYGKTFCFGNEELNKQKILLHNSSFD